MSHLRDLQGWLQSSKLTGMVIPSTDEFISEFAPPANRRLRWATGFRGSTGMAVVLRDSAALFLDGRYFVQGKADTAGTAISVESAALPSRRDWLRGSLPSGGQLGFDSRLHPTPDLAQWRILAAELGFELKLLADNPIDALWSQARPPEHKPPIVDYPVRYAGDAYQVKCAALLEHIEAASLQGFLIADPEDVSWLLNARAADESLKSEVGDWHIVPTCTSRVLILRDGRINWFADKERLSPDLLERGSEVVIAPPDTLAAALRNAARQGAIGVDPRRTPAALTAIIEEVGKVVFDDTVARRRWRKHPVEVQGARRAHIVDAVAVVRFMAWLKLTVPKRIVSEFEAAQKLEAFRAEHPDYKGASMPLMSASGPSGAQPHYVPRPEGSRNLNDHPIYWMNSGGQYLGGTTDNTLTLALRAPEAKHVRAHTSVLQSYIALAKACVPVGTYGVQLDAIARQPLWREGMDFAHGAGHGVGNYLNIHEGPSIGRELGPTTTVPIEPGMVVTNEPGYYVAGDFGLRIESHMVAVASRHPNFIEFETISRLPIDPRLVDFERLSPAERHWLADYHRTVLKDLAPLLDTGSAAWLRALVQTVVNMAGA